MTDREIAMEHIQAATKAFEDLFDVDQVEALNMVIEAIDAEMDTETDRQRQAYLDMIYSVAQDMETEATGRT